MEDSASPLPKVFVIGDSISIQYGPYLERNLEGVFAYSRKGGEAEALKNLDIAVGANGGDSSVVLEYLRQRLAQPDFQPTILLLNCGLHDIKVAVETGQIQISADAYRANLKAIVAAAGERGIPLVWVRTTHSVDEIHNSRSPSFHRFAVNNEAYDAIALEVMAESGVPVIDLRSFTRNLGEDRAIFCDHVHFADPVREKQGAFIAGWVNAWKTLTR